MDRRGFLKFAAGGTVGLVASPIIWNTLYDAVYWTQNWGWIPRLKKGENLYSPTVSKLCPSGTGFLVRMVAGTPVRTLGDSTNPISHGSMTALAAAEAELRVSPARLKKPLRRTADGAYVAISWEEAEKLLKEHMQSAGSSVTAFSGDPTTSINEVLSAMLAQRGSTDFYLMPDEEQSAAVAWAAMGGQGRLGYDLEHSDCVLAVGAPILESWGVVAANRNTFDRTHPVGGKPSQVFLYASAVQNNTAAGADLWVPIKPGTEMTLLLGIAHLLMKAKKAVFAAGLPNFDKFVAAYTQEKVTSITGVPADRLEAVVKALAGAQKPLVIAGSALGNGGAAGPVMAAIAVNMLLGSIGREGGLVDMPFPSPVLNGATEYRQLLTRSLVDYTQSVATGQSQAPKMLIIYAANPVYALPTDAGVAETIKKSGFSVAVASFMSETCASCDLVLPAALGMEALDDVLTPYGSGQTTYAFARPVAIPFAEARSAGELFIALAQELGLDLGVNDMLQLLNKRAYALGAPFRSMLKKGSVHIDKKKSPASPLFYNWEAIKATASAKGSDAPLQLAPVVILGMGTAQTAIPPFATKVVTDYQLDGKYSVAQMNGATAAKLKVREGDMLKITASNKVETTVRVAIFEGVVSDTISLTAGLGHTAFDQFSKGKGVNVVTLTSVSREPGTNLPVWGAIAVNAARA